MTDDHDRCSSGTGSPGCSRQNPESHVCVCVCVCVRACVCVCVSFFSADNSGSLLLNELLWLKSTRNDKLCLHWFLLFLVVFQQWNLIFSSVSRVLCPEELSPIPTSHPPSCATRKLLDWSWHTAFNNASQKSWNIFQTTVHSNSRCDDWWYL